ncbi:MAG: efflux RND transporter periplasmic adaptor subunit [bacterium]
MKKIIIVVSIIVIIVGAFLGFKGIFGRKDLSYEIVSVAKGEIVESISVNGAVIPAQQIDLQFEASGKIKSITAEVGDEVFSGQLLISLDSSEISAQVSASMVALDITKIRLDQVLAGNRPEDIQIYQTAVDKAEIDLENRTQALVDAQEDAENNLDAVYQSALNAVNTAYTTADQALLITIAGARQKYFNNYSTQINIGVREKEDIAKTDLSLSEDYLETAEINPTHSNIDLALNSILTALNSISDTLTVLRGALNNPLISVSVLSSDEAGVEAERTAINSKITSLVSAKQNISSTKINNQIRINTAQSNIDTAESVLQSAKDQLALRQAGPVLSDINLAQAQVRQAQANLWQVQARLDKMTLCAPVSGIITVIEKEQGEMAFASSPIISMISSNHFQIEANVSETEISKLELSDKVEMTLDALGPDEKFVGQVIKINPAETVVSGVIYYKITSVFDTEDKRIKSGMTVNLDIQTDKKENVLYLPYYTIKEKDGQKYVQILEDEVLKEKIIKVGLQGETMVEIIEGLSEGDKVAVEK